MSGSSGTFEWEIKSKLLTEMLNAKNGDEWKSDTFKILNLQFRLDVYPNGDGKATKNSFICVIRLKPWPSGIESIILCASQFCKQTMMSYTSIYTYTENDNSWGWSNNTLLLSDLNKNMKHLNIGVCINILSIKYNQSSLYLSKMLNNINNINYKKKHTISWNINKKLLRQWQCARIGKPFESKIFDNQWVIACYPNGMDKDCQGYLSVFIQLCGLPTTIKQIKVNHQIKCIQTNNEWNDTSDFSYNRSSRGRNFMKSTKMNKYSSLTLIVNIEIIEEEMDIDMISQQTDILNAKIVSLTKEQQQHKSEIDLLKNDNYKFKQKIKTVSQKCNRYQQQQNDNIDELREQNNLLIKENNLLKKENKSEIELLKNDNNKLKQNIKTLMNLFHPQILSMTQPKDNTDELRKQNDFLMKENHKLKFTASALKRVAQNLQPARPHDIEWTKTLSFNQLTIRSLSVQTFRIKIQQQPKYANLQPGQYCVENNTSNGYKYIQTERNIIKKFVQHNHIGNTNPDIQYKKNQFLSMEQILSTRKIGKCKHLPLLIGQRETYAKVNIDKHVIIGQYVGDELLKNEYYDIYNSTKEELDHLTYMHGDTLKLADGKTVEIYIDAFASNKTSPLLYINDGRKDIKKEATRSDEKRINTEFVMVLVNGWSMVLVRTTKKIKKCDSLWIHYGAHYGLVLDEQALIYDQRQKAMRSVQQIWAYIENNPDEPFDIFDDDDDLQNNSNKKRKLITMEDDSDDNYNDHNTNNSSSPRKRQRVR